MPAGGGGGGGGLETTVATSAPVDDLSAASKLSTA